MPSSEQQYFEKQKAAFKAAFENAVTASKAAMGQFVEQRVGWSTWIFARQCATARSVIRLLEIDAHPFAVLDHSSIAVLSRNLLEAHILIGYLLEDGISEEEWSCRKTVFDIHDCASRTRLFKGLDVEKEYLAHKEVLKELRTRLSANAHAKKLSKETLDRATSGSSMYLYGLRKAAEGAGWDPELFDAVYNYLSAQGHSAPLSFYRMQDSQIDYSATAPHQFGIAAFALEYGGEAIRHATELIGKRCLPKPG